VRLTVQDAGIGFGAQGMDKLFEAFYTTKSGGMGIGLSVSRSIIERHQGRLWAAPNDGPGATFSFSIPSRPEGVTGTHSFGAIRTPAATDAAHAAGNS
jgi:signal transduction histidine kinase